MRKTLDIFCVIVSSLLLVFIGSSVVLAQPYGQGLYGENVPYGDETSLSIATSGDLVIPVTPVSGGTLATGQNTVTVTSSDVVGYKLYVRSINSTDMDNLGSVIPASSNGTPAALANNTWGYNTDASANFLGMTLSDTLIHGITGPATGGDITQVTYGVKVDLAKPAGNYQTAVIYTAVPQTD
jgi:hypothetical protein